MIKQVIKKYLLFFWSWCRLVCKCSIFSTFYIFIIKGVKKWEDDVLLYDITPLDGYFYKRKNTSPRYVKVAPHSKRRFIAYSRPFSRTF